jgi:uroporphyrin-III C-methyltransferase/precorrin-2 dehydrogenase/sirohydrochlorin ferrochelatase
MRMRGAGVLVNVVDRPELCDFTTPAIIERTPLLVAVGTGGASAGLAKHVRLRLEALLPETLGALARGLYAARDALRARFPAGPERRRALDVALAQGGALDALDPASAERIERWLSGAADGPSDSVEVIHVRSADPDDLTLREARWLGMADGVAYEKGVSPAVLARARADAMRQTIEPAQAFSAIDGFWVVVRIS